jgi:hypothetical protein
LPTKQIEINDIVRLLIADLFVDPLRPDWRRLLLDP